MVAERWVKLTGQYLLEGYGLPSVRRWSALTRMILIIIAVDRFAGAIDGSQTGG